MIRVACRDCWPAGIDGTGRRDIVPKDTRTENGELCRLWLRVKSAQVRSGIAWGFSVEPKNGFVTKCWI